MQSRQDVDIFEIAKYVTAQMYCWTARMARIAVPTLTGQTDRILTIANILAPDDNNEGRDYNFHCNIRGSSYGDHTEYLIGHIGRRLWTALGRTWETHEVHWSVMKMVLMRRSYLSEGGLRIEERSWTKGLV
jgi:hypothetical protein